MVLKKINYYLRGRLFNFLLVLKLNIPNPSFIIYFIYFPLSLLIIVINSYSSYQCNDSWNLTVLQTKTLEMEPFIAPGAEGRCAGRCTGMYKCREKQGC